MRASAARAGGELVRHARQTYPACALVTSETIASYCRCSSASNNARLRAKATGGAQGSRAASERDRRCRVQSLPRARNRACLTFALRTCSAPPALGPSPTRCRRPPAARARPRRGRPRAGTRRRRPPRAAQRTPPRAPPRARSRGRPPAPAPATAPTAARQRSDAHAAKGGWDGVDWEVQGWERGGHRRHRTPGCLCSDEARGTVVAAPAAATDLPLAASGFVRAAERLPHRRRRLHEAVHRARARRARGGAREVCGVWRVRTTPLLRAEEAHHHFHCGSENEVKNAFVHSVGATESLVFVCCSARGGPGPPRTHCSVLPPRGGRAALLGRAFAVDAGLGEPGAHELGRRARRRASGAPTSISTPAPAEAPTVFPPVFPPVLPPVRPPVLPPTGAPTNSPTAVPTTAAPVLSPASIPTGVPTSAPSTSPSASSASPEASPTTSPTGVSVSPSATMSPTGSPTSAPSTSPSASSGSPQASPTTSPTGVSVSPSATMSPTGSPTSAPAEPPGLVPTEPPTSSPAAPVPVPAPGPIPAPDGPLTPSPAAQPTEASPTSAPAEPPGVVPTEAPTSSPAAPEPAPGEP